MEGAETPEPLRRAVFLDRDGTLMEEVDYCRRPEDVRVFPGVADALRSMRDAGWLAILITNQSGIGRGYFSQAEYEAVHAEFLHQIDFQLDGAYFCPDAPPMESPRRKPNPGMIFEAMRDFPIDPKQSWMIGDKSADIGCARAAGLRAALVRTGYGSSYAGPAPDLDATDAVTALQRISTNS